MHWLADDEPMNTKKLLFAFSIFIFYSIYILNSSFFFFLVFFYRFIWILGLCWVVCFIVSQSEKKSSCLRNFGAIVHLRSMMMCITKGSCVLCVNTLKSSMLVIKITDSCEFSLVLLFNLTQKIQFTCLHQQDTFYFEKKNNNNDYRPNP